MDMDEVNQDDLNELEARLYAQIHHEGANDVPNVPQENTENLDVPGVSRVPSTRYWTKGTSNVSTQHTWKNPNLNQNKPVERETNANVAHEKPNNNEIVVAQAIQRDSPITKVNQNLEQSAKQTNEQQEQTSKESQSESLKQPLQKQQQTSKESQSESLKQSLQQQQQTSKQVQQPPKLPQQSPKPQQQPAKQRQQQSAKQQQQQPRLNVSSNADIRVNPAAKAKAKQAKHQKQQFQIKQQQQHQYQHHHQQHHHQQQQEKQHFKLHKNGPFAEKQQKLQKIIQFAEKKQKSKQVRAKIKPKIIETIELESTTEESDNDDEDDDIIILPAQVPETINVLDSDEDNDETAKALKPDTELLKIDENAVDAADVEMDNAAFIKPATTTTTSNDKRNDNSSRCVSPCSVLSSDDFIGQTDRHRLLETSGPADDEDLLMLTADVANSSPKQTAAGENETRTTTAFESDFVAPTTSADDYRVEQSEFRALDVYESESDITDSVYSKGASRPTIIRTVVDSSDEETEQEKVEAARSTQKLKRLRKRRASGSQKGSETNHEDDDSSDSETENANRGVASTGLPYISRGIAVENCKSRLRTKSSSDKTRDNQFIATLNNLAQGGKTLDHIEGDVDSDTDNEPRLTARDIAEQVLQQEKQKSTSNALSSNNLDHLSKVFETIDRMDEPRPVPDSDVEELSNDVIDLDALPSRDNLPEKVVVDDDAEKDEATDLVHNLIEGDCRGVSDGFGWNLEMRRFYNNSWKGENFNLKELWHKMDSNKKLWKIYTEDRFPKERRYTNLKCFNCCEFGHVRSKCKRPKKPAICYMCGERGHFEPRCPNTICLRCGNKTNIFTKSCDACTFQNRIVCPLCKVRGHSLNFCPDKWRRYHSTTETNEFPYSGIRYNNRKFCCICAKKGHHSEHCRSAIRFMEYPVIVSSVKSHQKSYNDVPLKERKDSMFFNLLHQPTKRYELHIVEHTNASKYYGRFLKAVGLGYMLKQKQKQRVTSASKRLKAADNDEEQPSTSTAIVSEIVDATTPPEQVQEISESGGNLDDEPLQAEVVEIEVASRDEKAAAENTEAAPEDAAEKEVAVSGDTEMVEVQAEVEVVAPENTSNDFKAPAASPTQQLAAVGGKEKEKETEAMHLDSDSNYSFSEHFGVPPTTTKATTEKSETTTKETREMAPLLDFIPLTADTEEQNNEGAAFSGISNRFITADTDDDESRAGTSPAPDAEADTLPCEAKIYLTQNHSKYLLSAEGHTFLETQSKECDVKVRLDFTSVGHVLVIFGTRDNQDVFHKALLNKYNELSSRLSSQRVDNNIQKVPKRADVLIRFLRENLNQLYSNLGNVNDLLKRLNHFEHQQSKTSFKSAEKTRRSLNMILLGQAGLCNGNVHLDKLLHLLKTLIDDYKSEENASNEIRNEIDSHWKAIFTPYGKQNYPELVQHYNKLPSKNRIPQLRIDPLLLGRKVLDVELSSVQKDRLQQSTTSFVPNPLNPRNTKKRSLPFAVPPAPSMILIDGEAPPPAPSMHVKAARGTPNKSSTGSLLPPYVNPSQKSRSPAIMANSKWQSTCDDLLTAIESPSGNGNGNGSRVHVSKGPSIFWSRESIKYLDECIALAECNRQLLEKLQRVLWKSRAGKLSYNDYRAVIKLHSAMVGK